MAPDDSVLVVEGISKRFGGVAALDGFSLVVRKGEIRCIVGPNGAGKSTLFRAIAGLVEPDEGTIRVLGRRTLGLSDRQIARMGVATKFQNPRVFPSLTVTQHIGLAARVAATVPRLLGYHKRAELDRERELTNRIIEDLDLGRMRHHLVGDLGHGERQWLEIVMLLSTEPKLLLLDEPGAGMSAAEKERTATLVEHLSERMTILIIEHDLSFVQRLGRDVLVMHQGRLLTQGSFEHISRDPEVGRVYLGASLA